jgi:sterol 3beta-glucosyltransferase
MTLPIRDILASEKSKATHFGRHGLIIIVKGHEELFFEFSSEDKRDAFVQLLERQMEDMRRRIASGEPIIPSPAQRDALVLEEFEARKSTSSDSEPTPLTDTMADSLPAVMFTSASSTFLTFKPKRSLHFTFLTIGSRGDVQPYIALAKGLMADGHKCRIATHGEFQEWIESVRPILFSDIFLSNLLMDFVSMESSSALLEVTLRNSCESALRMGLLPSLFLKRVC